MATIFWPLKAQCSLGSYQLYNKHNIYNVKLANVSYVLMSHELMTHTLHNQNGLISFTASSWLYSPKLVLKVHVNMPSWFDVWGKIPLKGLFGLWIFFIESADLSGLFTISNNLENHQSCRHCERSLWQFMVTGSKPGVSNMFLIWYECLFSHVYGTLASQK